MNHFLLSSRQEPKKVFRRDDKFFIRERKDLKLDAMAKDFMRDLPLFRLGQSLENINGLLCGQSHVHLPHRLSVE